MSRAWFQEDYSGDNMYTELELRKLQASDYLEGYQDGGSEEQSRFTFQP